MQHYPFLFLFYASLPLACCLIAISAINPQTKNDPPEIEIKNPAPGYRFDWNTAIRYEISVTDKEDGTSAYDEIPVKEVLLKIRFLPDTALAARYAREEEKLAEPAALSMMKMSTCFNCHAVKGKLIGPSFEAVANRYPHDAASVERLAGKIIQGSEGVWGEVQMPPHPDLSAVQAREITKWILSSASDPDVEWFAGLEGAFMTKAKLDKNPGKAAYLLTASYTDHGDAASSAKPNRSKHTIILRSK